MADPVQRARDLLAEVRAEVNTRIAVVPVRDANGRIRVGNQTGRLRSRIQRHP